MKTRLAILSSAILLFAALLPLTAFAAHPTTLPAGCDDGPYTVLEPTPDGDPAGDDDYVGTAGNDFVYDLVGDNSFDASGTHGNDCIVFGGGTDDATTGDGNDYIDAGGGDDKVDAGDGEDTLVGGVGDDRLDGGPGFDGCDGGPGTNTLTDCEVTPDDSDGDGVDNGTDLCPNTAPGEAVNADGCSADDLLDDDGDGVNNGTDNCVAVANLDQLDTDGDGAGDACDDDDDNDGFDDSDETAAGSDPLDPLSTPEICDGLDNDLNDGADEGFGDADGDGTADCVDTGDFDGDGDPDNADNCPAVANADQLDTDGDGAGDACDDDDDNDGFDDSDETIAGSDPLDPLSTPEICDGLDNDLDGTTDEGFGDADGDGTADCVDTGDFDGDGDPDNADNCPAVANADQLDTDGDGLGDVCDLDDDGDGHSDTDETTAGSDPLDPLSTPEICDGVDNDLDGTNDEGFGDADGDGTADCVDTGDFDGDGDPDNADNCPAVANPDQLDTDGDGLGNACDLDDDGDGVSDVVETGGGSDPLNPLSTPENCADAIDNDLDGIINEGCGGGPGPGGGAVVVPGGGGGGGAPAPVPTPLPAPGRCVDEAPTSNFRDVADGHIHERAIDCIAWKGITTGMAARRYGPSRITTRGQMATFIARTIEEAGGSLPTGTNAFMDDNRNVHQAAINALAAAGVVEGTSARTFSPNLRVTRDQMASMIVHTYQYMTDAAADPSEDHFTDDNGNTHEDNINVGADLGLVFGRTATTYDPAAGTRRAQMASFLTRLLDLLGAASA